MKIEDLEATQFELMFDGTPTLLELVRGVGCKRWRIRRDNAVLGKYPVINGYLYFQQEPLPSSRDEAFYQEFRWDSALEALQFWEQNQGRVWPPIAGAGPESPRRVPVEGAGTVKADTYEFYSVVAGGPVEVSSPQGDHALGGCQTCRELREELADLRNQLSSAQSRNLHLQETLDVVQATLGCSLSQRYWPRIKV